MAKRLAACNGEGQSLPADLVQLVDQLERHCMAPDGSLVSRPVYNELQLAREGMLRERQGYLQAMAIYRELISMVDDHNQSISMPNVRGMRDFQGITQQHSLRKNSNQVYELLEHRLAVAEAAQKLRLPPMSKDGETMIDEIEKTDAEDPGIVGARNCFLGITPTRLSESNRHEMSATSEIEDFRTPVSAEIEFRLREKHDTITKSFQIDGIDNLMNHTELPERVKLVIEEVEKEEAALQDDLCSANRKFTEYYSVLEQILGVLIKLVKDLKLDHQHKYDEMQKTWLCKRCETMIAKLRVLEHVLLYETYTKETVPALHKIRDYIIDATEEASLEHKKAMSRLEEFQGADPHFDSIARQYSDITKKLENMQWTINQVEMDLK